MPFDHKFYVTNFPLTPEIQYGIVRTLLRLISDTKEWSIHYATYIYWSWASLQDKVRDRR